MAFLPIDHPLTEDMLKELKKIWDNPDFIKRIFLSQVVITIHPSKSNDTHNIWRELNEGSDLDVP